MASISAFNVVCEGSGLGLWRDLQASSQPDSAKGRQGREPVSSAYFLSPRKPCESARKLVFCSADFILPEGVILSTPAAGKEFDLAVVSTEKATSLGRSSVNRRVTIQPEASESVAITTGHSMPRYCHVHPTGWSAEGFPETSSCEPNQMTLILATSTRYLAFENFSHRPALR